MRLKWVVRGGLTEKVTFKPRLEGGEVSNLNPNWAASQGFISSEGEQACRRWLWQQMPHETPDWGVTGIQRRKWLQATGIWGGEYSTLELFPESTLLLETWVRCLRLMGMARNVRKGYHWDIGKQGRGHPGERRARSPVQGWGCVGKKSTQRGLAGWAHGKSTFFPLGILPDLFNVLLRPNPLDHRVWNLPSQQY